MRTLHFIILSLLINFTAISQDPPIKWKEVPMEQMKMTEYSADPSAPAIILCDYGQYYFDVNPNGRNLFLFNERQIRIKILKPEGLKYAHIRVPYKDMTCEDFPGENSIIIKGMTYNLDNKGVIKATKLKQSKIKHIDSTGCYRIAEFELPNVKPGSIIEYKISIPTLDLISPQKWNFQNEIPTLYSEFRMRVPSQFNYLFSPQNIQNFEISEEKYFNQTLMFNPRTYNPYYRAINPLVLYGKQIRLVKTNIDKFENPSFTNKPEDFYQSVKIHLAKATRENSDYNWDYLTYALAITTTEDYDLHEPKQRKLISYPAAYIYYKLPDWEKFNQKLLKSDRFGLALVKHWNYEQILENITKGKESPEQKMISVYDFIRKNMRWTGEYSIFADPVFSNTISKLYTRVTKKLGNERSLRKPFEEGKGTSSEINLTLIYLLNKAGIETDPVIISTRDHGRIDTAIPDPKQFNHVIARAIIDGKTYFLDAIDSLRPYNLLDQNDYTAQGFLVKGIGYGWINVESTEPNILSVVEQIDLDSDLNFKSKLKVTKSGYFAFNDRKKISSIGTEEFIKKESEKFDIPLLNNKIETGKNDSDTLYFELSKDGKSDVSGQISFLPKFYTVYSENDFNDYFRKYPVNLSLPLKNSYQMQINIPEGYSVQLPKNESFTTYGDNASYKYEISRVGNKIIVKIDLEIKITDFPAEEYSNLKQLFAGLEDKVMEAIVISKVKP